MLFRVTPEHSRKSDRGNYCWCCWEAVLGSVVRFQGFSFFFKGVAWPWRGAHGALVVDTNLPAPNYHINEVWYDEKHPCCRKNCNAGGHFGSVFRYERILFF